VLEIETFYLMPFLSDEEKQKKTKRALKAFEEALESIQALKARGDNPEDT